MSNPVVGPAADSAQEALAKVAEVLASADEAIRALDPAVVGATPLVERLDDLHRALAVAMSSLGEGGG